MKCLRGIDECDGRRGIWTPFGFVCARHLSGEEREDLAQEADRLEANRRETDAIADELRRARG